MVKTLKDHIRLESILFRLGGIRANWRKDSFINLFVSAGSQGGNGTCLVSYVLKQVVHPRHLLDTPSP